MIFLVILSRLWKWRCVYNLSARRRLITSQLTLQWVTKMRTYILYSFWKRLEGISPILVSLIRGKVTQTRTLLQETTLAMTYTVRELGHTFAEFWSAEVTQRPETHLPKGITGLSFLKAVVRVPLGRGEQTCVGVVARPRAENMTWQQFSGKQTPASRQTYTRSDIGLGSPVTDGPVTFC
jgi:hypothetical protein